jgi:hypothetical protein
MSKEMMQEMKRERANMVTPAAGKAGIMGMKKQRAAMCGHTATDSKSSMKSMKNERAMHTE